MKTGLANAFLLLGSIVFALVVAEVAVRLAGLAPEVGVVPVVAMAPAVSTESVGAALKLSLPPQWAC